MDKSWKKIAEKICDMIYDKRKREPEPYDTTATVRRVENGKAYVHIPGGVDETPVALTIDAAAGDTVQVRVANGGAWLVGNRTAPPTDDAVALVGRELARIADAKADTAEETAEVAQEVANKASKTAENVNQYFWHTETGTDTGAHITEIPREQFLEDPDNGGGNLLARSNGIAIRDGLDELAHFSANGTQIGKDDNVHTIFNTDGLKFYLDENTNPVNLDIRQDQAGYRWGYLFAKYQNNREAGVRVDADSHTVYSSTYVYTEDPNGEGWATEVQTNPRGIRQLVQAGGGQATYAEVTLRPKSADYTDADFYNMELYMNVPIRAQTEEQELTLTSQFDLYTAGDANSKPIVRKFGNVCDFTAVLTPTSAIAGSTTLHTITTIPEGFRPSQVVRQICQGSGNAQWLLSIATDGTVSFSRYHTTASGANAYASCAAGNWLPIHATWIM